MGRAPYGVGSLLLLLGATSACGGLVEEDSAPGATPNTTNTSNVPGAHDCATACARMDACTGSVTSGCLRSCEVEHSEPASAVIYSRCIGELSCAEILQGQYMSYGPIGACHNKARRAKP